MSSADKPMSKPVRTRVRELTVGNLLWAAAAMAVIDLTLALCGIGMGWKWAVVLAVEVLLLAVFAWRSYARAKRALTPMEQLLATAEQMKASALEGHDLRRLAKKLERVEEPGLAQKLAVAGSGEELAVLLDALNDMLDRIDQRYQAQRRFTGDASHELRTPLAVIISYIDRLDRKGRNDPRIMDDCIEAIRESAEFMRRLIEDLLLLARGDSKTQKLVLQSVDLSELIHSVARKHSMVDDKRAVRVRAPEGVTAVADRDLLYRCLWVLTENAQKYTPDGGEIRLTLDCRGDNAQITVEDTGIGIAEQDLPHVFERFYRADASRARNTGGTGLGLAIAKTIAEEHGGHLTVASKVGEGTAFTLTIPMDAQKV